MLKVLLVTNQYIEDSGSTYRCDSNVYEIIKRFSFLGELSLYARRYNQKRSHSKITESLDGVIKYGNVSFSKVGVFDLLFLSKHNKKAISKIAVKQDLIISYGASFDLYEIAKKYNKKFMSYVVSCMWDAYWNHGWQGKMVALYKYALARYTILKSDYVLYVSNQFLQKRYPTKAKYQLGCSDVIIMPLSNDILEKRLDFIQQWDGEVLNIATTAAVDVSYKGQQYVIEAMSKLKKMGKTNIHYYLIGGGSQKRLQSKVDKLELTNQVHFLGIVPHDNVFEILDNIHIYIQPSLQEGLPRSVVEAMSRGIMCVGANTAAIPELIDAKYVIRRKSVDDIVNILNNTSKEELICQAKRNFTEAKHYQDEVLSERRNKFFQKIIEDISQSQNVSQPTLS